MPAITPYKVADEAFGGLRRARGAMASAAVREANLLSDDTPDPELVAAAISSMVAEATEAILMGIEALVAELRLHRPPIR